MRRTLITLILSGLISGTAVWAANDEVVSDEVNLSSTAGAREVTRGYLNNELVGIKPQLGLMVFTDQNGDSTSRALGGVTIDTNLAPMISKNLKSLYLGPSTGFLYSHLGRTGSNFVGTIGEDNGLGGAGANLLIIPATLKIGYNFTDNLRLSVHGGGNVVYRSIANSLNLGPSSSETSDSIWRLFPSAGGSAEFGLGKNVALMLRPDWTFTPGDNFFTATAALNIPIG